MSTINTNVPSLAAQRHLATSQHALSRSLDRLSSGLRINRGADDPAGLIVSERLRSEIEAVNQAVSNSNRAINMIATAEGALDEVAALLIDIEGLLIEASNSGAFSDEEIAANQLQVDDAIKSITRIANTTTFAGRKLIDGQLDYLTSGVDAAILADVQVLGASFGTNEFLGVNVDVAQSAQRGQLFFPSAQLGGSAVAFDIQGIDGILTLNFPASATSVDVVNEINANSDATGVRAVASGTNGSAGFRIESLGFGANAFVKVDTLSGTFELLDESGVVDTRDEGRNAVATINGASTVSNGLKLAVSTAQLQVEVTLDEDFGAGATSFAITGGGALFQLGPSVGSNQQANIGVRSMQANKLGDEIDGFLSELMTGQPHQLNKVSNRQASRIVEKVIDQVSVLRGRLGAFERNTLQTNINQLQITAENLTSSESSIRDTDFAVETSELTRAQILVQAGNSVLAIANAQSQNVLTLLGG